MTPNLRRMSGIAIRSLFVAAIAWLVLHNVDLREAALVATPRLLLGVIMAQPLLVLAVTLLALRYGLLARVPPVPLPTSTAAVALSIALNLLLPARMSELVKATYVREHAGVPLADGVAASAVGNLLDVVVLAGIALIASSMQLAKVNDMFWLAILGIAIIACLCVPVVARFTAWLPDNVVGRFIANVMRSAADRYAQGVMLKVCLLTIGYWSAAFCAFAIMLLAGANAQLTVWAVAAAYVGSLVGGIVSVLPGGIGTYEAGIMLPLMLNGMSFSTALGLAVSVHFGTLLAPVGIGLVVLLRKSTGMGSAIRDARKLR